MSAMQAGFDYIGVNVAFLCHDGKGRLLLHLRSDKCRDEHNTWDNGAGQVEFGETLEAAVTREVEEEYGCKALKIEHFLQFTALRQHEGRPTHWLINTYVVRVDPKTVKVMEPERNLRNGWFTVDNLPQPLHSLTAMYFAKYRVKLEKMLSYE